MAKPDCDDGYYKLSYELGAALLSFGFGEIEGHILAVVLETQYGLGKRKYVELSPAKLADEWQVDRSNVHRAIGRLVAHNVLLSLGDNQYQLLKDYANWEKKGAPGRVTLWKAFVSDAPRRAKALRPLPPPKDRDDLIIEGMPGVDDEPATAPMPVVSKDNTQAEVDQSSLSSKTTNRCLQRQQTVVSKDNSVDSSPRPPIGEAHAELELRRGEVEKKSKAPLAPPRGEAAAGDQLGDDEPFMPGPNAQPPVTVDWAVVDQRIAEVQAVIGGLVAEPRAFTGYLESWAVDYPSDWIIKAIEHVGYKGINPRRPHGFAASLLATWGNLGGPENDPKYMSSRKGANSGLPGTIPKSALDAKRKAEWDAFTDLDRKAKEATGA